MQSLFSSRKTALALLAVLGATAVPGLGLRPAQADDSKSAKIAAMASGAAALYGVLSGKGKVATIGGLAAAGAYAKYRADRRDEQKDDDRRDRRRNRNNRQNRRFDDSNYYGNGYYNNGSTSYGNYNTGYGNGGYYDNNYDNGGYYSGNNDRDCRDNDRYQARSNERGRDFGRGNLYGRR